MKKLVLVFILFSCIVLSCTNDEKTPAKGTVQFAIAVTAKSSAGGRIAIVLPDGAFVSFSIETSSGVSVYSFTKTELIKLGDDYITAPIALPEAGYRLTDFMVLSKENEVLYATPKEGSDLAGLVEDPLPINFSITKDGIINLNVQVVGATQQAPQDFGYASFGIDVITGGDFSVSLFTTDNHTLSLSSGTLLLYHNNELVHTQDLSSKVNTISFKGDSTESYTLFVKKEGYSVRSKTYKLHDLLNELAGKPLTFILEPALTMTTVHHVVFDNDLPFSYNLGIMKDPNSPYKLIVDWGDGTIENVEGITDASGFSSVFILHFYADSLIGKPSYMNMTGDIAKISFFYFVNPIPLSVKTMDVAALTTLSRVAWMVVSAKEDTPEHMDFSKNTVLTSLYLRGTKLEYLDLCANPLVYQLDIVGTNILNDNVNAIVNEMHNNAVNRHLTHGIFGYDPQTLTPESIAKLIDLRDNYAWDVYPNP